MKFILHRFVAATFALLLVTALADPTPLAGKASWYGEEHAGRPMANGKPFDPGALTCASWHFPLGIRIEVRHAGRKVTVVVTDRGPGRRFPDRVVDLSRAAFARLADPDVGLIEVTVAPLP
ncbi:lipoprotein [Opitutaceae bacterium TAV1]|nr:lipoprotein [Opitutaceae bacterium TAV1]